MAGGPGLESVWRSGPGYPEYSVSARKRIVYRDAGRNRVARISWSRSPHRLQTWPPVHTQLRGDSESAAGMVILDRVLSRMVVHVLPPSAVVGLINALPREAGPTATALQQNALRTFVSMPLHSWVLQSLPPAIVLHLWGAFFLHFGRLAVGPTCLGRCVR
jgi:hypothetical protein